jgi:hypothetical protein
MWPPALCRLREYAYRRRNKKWSTEEEENKINTEMKKGQTS